MAGNLPFTHLPNTTIKSGDVNANNSRIWDTTGGGVGLRNYDAEHTVNGGHTDITATTITTTSSITVGIGGNLTLNSGNLTITTGNIVLANGSLFLLGGSFSVIGSSALKGSTTVSGNLTVTGNLAVNNIVGGFTGDLFSGNTLTTGADTFNLLNLKAASATQFSVNGLGQITKALPNFAVGADVTVDMTSTTFIDVPNLTVTITTTGRPVEIFFEGIDGGTIGEVNIKKLVGQNANSATGRIKLVRDTTDVKTLSIGFIKANMTTNLIESRYPASSFRYFDEPAAGTYTYKIQCRTLGAGRSIAFSELKLVAKELV